MTDRLLELRQQRLAELRAMGAKRIQAEIQRAVRADWKADRTVEIKIKQHRHEWGREDLSVEELRAIGRRIKLDPASRIFTYIHDSFPHHRGYCFVSPKGEVLHYRVDKDVNKTCFKPRNLGCYLQTRLHWIHYRTLFSLRENWTRISRMNTDSFCICDHPAHRGRISLG